MDLKRKHALQLLGKQWRLEDLNSNTRLPGNRTGTIEGRHHLQAIERNRRNMTCIVGFIQNKAVWMAGDSAAVDEGYCMDIRKDPKVIIRDNLIFGFTDTWGVGQAFEDFKIPKHPSGTDNVVYVRKILIPAYRKYIKKEEVDWNFGGNNALLGYKGELYVISGDWEITRSRSKYRAIGCAEDFALGALYMIEKFHSKLPPQEKLTLALRAACKHSAGVHGPFTIGSVR